MAAEPKSAVFAGGCFWCLEGPFDALPGVIETESGYTGGESPNPTYEEVSSGTSGHIEAMRVVYDPEKIDYKKLLDVFWRNIDPTDGGGQFCDRGPQYRSAIFFGDAAEEAMARETKAQLEDAKGFKMRRRSSHGLTFMRPRSTIRIITRKIQSAIISIVRDVVGICASSKSGARRRMANPEANCLKSKKVRLPRMVGAGLLWNHLMSACPYWRRKQHKASHLVVTSSRSAGFSTSNSF